MDPLELPLRDIHLPPDPAWFPPAWGWFALLFFVVLAAAIAWWLYRRMSARRIGHDLRDALFVLRLDYIQEPDQRRLLRELSIWYRRALISATPPECYSSLTGEAWLSALDGFDPEQRRFTTGVGRILAHGPYLPNIQFDAHAVLTLSEEWLKRFMRAERRGEIPPAGAEGIQEVT
ncbi:MAG: DUF4381 domain-containing protein [Candidatus Eutrophobiaceae bacterium]